MDQLSKLSPLHLGKNSAIDVNFHPYPPKESLIENEWGQPTMTLPAKVFSNTNIPTNNQPPIHEELQNLVVSHIL